VAASCLSRQEAPFLACSAVGLTKATLGPADAGLQIGPASRSTSLPRFGGHSSGAPQR
jgi:hypothetical protein